MSFLRPEVLFWGWPVLLIPILIHLFNLRRYRTLYFPNVRFLAQITQQRRTRNRLRDWLLLTTRLLLLAALLLAFALPVIQRGPNASADAQPAVSLYLDNSFSMNSEDGQESLFALGKRLSESLIRRNDPRARIQVMSNALSARQGRFYAPDQAVELLEGIQVGPEVQEINQILERQELALKQLEGEGPRLRIIVSDFQKSVLRPEALDSSRRMRTLWIPLERKSVRNLYIDTVRFEAPFVFPGRQTECVVRIHNAGSEDVEDLSVRLKLNAQDKAVSQVDVPAEGSAETSLVFTPERSGWNKAEIGIKDFPVTFDDRFYFTFQIQPQARVLYLSDNHRPSVKAAFGTDEYFQLERSSLRQFDFSRLGQFALVLVEQRQSISEGAESSLSDYVRDGGNLMSVPSEEADHSVLGSFAQTFGLPPVKPAVANSAPMGKPDIDNPFFTDVFESIPDEIDMPTVQRYFPIAQSLPFESEALLRLRNDAPILVRRPQGQGNYFMLQMPLDPDWTNLAEHSLFVPMLFKATLYGSGRRIFHGTVGGGGSDVSPVQPRNVDQVLVLEGPAGKTFIPRQRYVGNQYRLFAGALASQSGFYALRTQQDSAANAKPLAWMAYNYDRRESDLSAYSLAELENWASQYAYTLESNPASGTQTDAQSMIRPYRPLWLWFLWAALVFLLVEVAVAKWPFGF